MHFPLLWGVKGGLPWTNEICFLALLSMPAHLRWSVGVLLGGPGADPVRLVTGRPWCRTRHFPWMVAIFAGVVSNARNTLQRSNGILGLFMAGSEVPLTWNTSRAGEAVWWKFQA